MIRLVRWGRQRSPALAAVEFALTCPILLAFFAGAADFGLAYYAQSCMANAVAAGAEYATITGPSVTAANIQTLVQHESGLTGVSASVTGPACYCAGASPTLPAAYTGFSALPCNPSASTTQPVCGAACTVGGVSGYYGTYVQLTASYTYNGIMPAYSMVTSPHMSKSATNQLPCT